MQWPTHYFGHADLFHISCSQSPCFSAVNGYVSNLTSPPSFSEQAIKVLDVQVIFHNSRYFAKSIYKRDEHAYDCDWLQMYGIFVRSNGRKRSTKWTASDSIIDLRRARVVMLGLRGSVSRPRGLSNWQQIRNTGPPRLRCRTRTVRQTACGFFEAKSTRSLQLRTRQLSQCGLSSIIFRFQLQLVFLQLISVSYRNRCWLQKFTFKSIARNC